MIFRRSASSVPVGRAGSARYAAITGIASDAGEAPRAHDAAGQRAFRSSGSGARRRAVALLLVFLGACATRSDRGAPRTEVPFVAAHGLVFVEVDIADRGACLALFDTGANAS